jgi:DNA-binding response OmpR family regulator
MYEGFDVVILDVMLPKRTGWQVVEQLRAARVNVPILMLTARDETKDKVKGLNLGADDYLAKPFDADELVARVHALGRRDKIQKGAKIVVADLEIDRDAREAIRAGRRISLTRREFDLLEALAINQDRVLSRDTIQERVWGDEPRPTNTVDVFVANLRKKVDVPFGKRLIHTSVGTGYVLRTDP